MLRKARIVALIAAQSCVRRALTAVTALRELSERQAPRASELEDLRAEVHEMHRTLQRLGSRPEPDAHADSKLLLQ